MYKFEYCLLQNCNLPIKIWEFKKVNVMWSNTFDVKNKNKLSILECKLNTRNIIFTMQSIVCIILNSWIKRNLVGKERVAIDVQGLEIE
jgi:hypothetical protein